MKYLDNYYYLDNIEHFNDLKGDIGPTGPQGIQGVQGNVGLKGLSGRVGSDGIKGSPGFTGERGNKGDKGDRGNIGDVGSQGIKGVKGPQGPDGITGPRGYRGPRGKVGSIGEKGIDGQKGLAGPRGDSGVSFSINDFDVTTNNPSTWEDNIPAPIKDSDKKDEVLAKVESLGGLWSDETTTTDTEGKTKTEAIDELEDELKDEGVIPEDNKWFRIPVSPEYTIGAASRCPNNGAIVGVRSNRLYQTRLGYKLWKPVGCTSCMFCGFRNGKIKYCPPKMDWLTGGGCWPCKQKFGWRHWQAADVHQKQREYEILCSPMPSGRKEGEDEYTANFDTSKPELIDEFWHTNSGGDKDKSLKRYPFYLPD